MGITTGQLEFDFELDAKVDRGFPEMQTPENGGLCSRCGRKLKGHYARFHGGMNAGLWFAWCDTCTETAQGIRRGAVPE